MADFDNIKVLILANFDVGLYKFRKELIETLIDRGAQIWIALPQGDMIKPLVDMGCVFIDTQVDRRGVNPFKDRALMKNYEKIVSEIRPNIMISYTIKPNIYGGAVCSLKKVKYFANITGLGTAFQKTGILKRIVITMYKRALKDASVVFFENEDNCNTLKKLGIIRQEQAVCLKGAGVNLDEYEFCDYPLDSTTRFLFIGRIMKEKGIDELLTAAKAIKENGIDAEFDIVGPYEDDYKDIIMAVHSDGIINYHGFQADVRPFIRKAHAYVLPSYHEGMSNTLLENAAMGRPLITSDIPGCREALIDGVSGLLCRVADAKSLYQKLVEFIKLDDTTRQEMGRKSRRLMEDEFDKKSVVGKTIEAIAAAINSDR